MKNILIGLMMISSLGTVTAFADDVTLQGTVVREIVIKSVHWDRSIRTITYAIDYKLKCDDQSEYFLTAQQDFPTYVFGAAVDFLDTIANRKVTLTGAITHQPWH